MIKFVSGDFFDYDADIRVNTVNCVGIMGAGVALLFKNKYPDMFKEYVKLCKEGELKPGKPVVWHGGDMLSKKVDIINFPTKDDWRDPSEYSYVETGLEWLSDYLSDKNGKVVTLPALGCGHGGLQWERVKSLIAEYLSDSPAEILVFEPISSKKINKNTEYDPERELVLNDAQVKVMHGRSHDYPEALHRYTEKDLYVYPKLEKNFNFDMSLIISNSPKKYEIEVAEIIVNFCVKNNFSLLLGGSSFDRKLAFKMSSRGLKVGCFLPSGIVFSSRKLLQSDEDIVLMSLGDPLVQFDKRGYLPSVISRFFLSKNVIFLTSRLTWLQKYREKIISSKAKLFFVDYPEIDQEQRHAVLGIGSQVIDYHSLVSSKLIDEVKKS